MSVLEKYKARGAGSSADATELANARRQLAEAETAKKNAEDAAAKAADAIRAANASRDATVLEGFLSRVAAKHRATNPGYVSTLLGSSYEVLDGKTVKVKGTPDADPEKHADEWFSKDGKVFAGPTQAGAGASPNAGNAPQAAPIDMSTEEGRTQHVRSLGMQQSK